MRITFILVLLSLLSNCRTHKTRDTFIPKEYDYPDDSILNGKTFIYEDANTGEKSYTDYFTKLDGKKKYIITTQYSRGKTYDSSIYLNDEMVETYSSPYVGAKLFKCEIPEDTVIKDGTKLGQSKTTTILRNDSNAVLSSVISKYWKDTLIAWRNEIIPCIVIRQKCKDEYLDIKNRTKDSLVYYQNGYYGKNIGLLRYRVLFNNRVTTIELKEIIDRK